MPSSLLFFPLQNLYTKCQENICKLCNSYLTLSQTSPRFYTSAMQLFFKTLWEKEKLLVTSNFSFSHNVFYPFGELSTIFIKPETVICKFFQFGSIQNLSFGKGLTHNFSLHTSRKKVFLLFTKRQNFGHDQTESRRQNKCRLNVDFCLWIENIVGKGDKRPRWPWIAHLNF